MSSSPESSSPLPNLPLPTLGGLQFWTDHIWNDGWRLQQHALTGHWRLLSPSNVRYAWGTRAACEQAMQDRVDRSRVPDTRIVVLIHGLLRSSQSMGKLREALLGSGPGRPVAFEYASTRKAISEHAAALREWVETLPGQPRVDFVCHSMGNIVARRAFADWQRQGDPHGVLPRIGKMVMLGPPNQGADIARRLGKLGLFEIVTGRGGMELGAAWESFQQELATPPCPFAIVAGDLTASWLQNPLLSGPSDFLVLVEETRLQGAVEHRTVPVLHSLLMNDASVQHFVSEFLQG
ncbi:esterase/lipase family protein [Candidatus Laterigemmans baculatus]|uniref:esterase/lipase family protein n=1 Tax=Candidatus Laterigemmans baculatus TaxID=2770505 RepID=UPI0013DC3A99|nr:alpha/beta hydrolase [Candidatus Laterigemmans baculatus]